ncbi:PA2169 family four-helix-bundle protein [Aquimarina sp. W85]|uniref:ferritin-like domain-containing protein n=1 Tax=Aquimarina rhodophyticola TaxID=3342246 RepID=UPI00366BFDD6
MTTTKNIIEVINNLIEKNYDANKGYLKAAEKVDATNLAIYFKENASNRLEFAEMLKNELHTYAEHDKIKSDGSTTGTLHRTWMDIKSAFSSDNDEQILEECIRGDKASLAEYEEALETYAELPPRFKRLIQEQITTVRTTLNRIKSLEDFA